MDVLTYKQLTDAFWDHNEQLILDKKNRFENKMKGVIVFTADSFDGYRSLESRSFVVTSDNKAYTPGMCGYSIFASSLDGGPLIRLEQYMYDEHGGENGWKVDYCYILGDGVKE